MGVCGIWHTPTLGAYIFSSKNNISQELRTGGDGYFMQVINTLDFFPEMLILFPLLVLRSILDSNY